MSYDSDAAHDFSGTPGTDLATDSANWNRQAPEQIVIDAVAGTAGQQVYVLLGDPLGRRYPGVETLQ